MRTSRLSILTALALSAACASGNPTPEGGTGPVPEGQTGRRPMVRPGSDSARRNKVIENARPDAPARAGMLVVANQQGASATIVNTATMETIATLPVGNGPHEAAVSPDGRWAVVTIYGDSKGPGNTLAVIDLAAMPLPVVTRTITLGQYTRPHGAAFIRGIDHLDVGIGSDDVGHYRYRLLG